MKTIKGDFSIGQSTESKNKKAIEEKSEESSYAEYFNLGFYLVIPLLVGVFGGILLDNWFQTKPIFTITLILFGSTASFYNLIRLTKK